MPRRDLSRRRRPVGRSSRSLIIEPYDGGHIHDTYVDSTPDGRVLVQRINTDGRVIVAGRETEQSQFLACMAAEAREQRRSKPDLIVPEPVVNPLPR